MPSGPLVHYVNRWDPVLERKVWRRRGGIDTEVGTSFDDPDPPADPGVEQKFAGHVPNRVIVGMATPAGTTPPPGWNEARTIIGQPLYETRRFSSSWVSASEFNDMVDQADSISGLPFISFKVPGGSDGPGWTDVATGGQDAGLLNLFNYIVAYNKPLLCSFEHEPTGTGVTNADLTEWARMHTRCTYWFAGYRNCTVSSSGVVVLGTYNQAHDLTLRAAGLLAWAPIPNGFVWRSLNNNTLIGQRNAMCPTWLITALNSSGGILCPDFYDSDYVNQDAAYTDAAYRTPGTGVRTSLKISRFLTWARQVGLKATGCGEFGCIDGSDLLATWAVMRANRDIWCVANYFNSLANSDHDWRLVPADYPDTNYVSSKTNSSGQGFQDLGGNAQSAGRLAAFKTVLTESTSSSYTGPV